MDNLMGQNRNKTQSELYVHIQKNEAEFIQLILDRLGIITHPQNKELHNIVLNACDKFKCTPDDYLSMLTTSSNNSPALEFLVSGITVGETYFFRDTHQMNLLSQKILPEIIQKKRQENNLSLRIWSAGCSTGEEIYTIAIILKELLPDLRRWSLHLLGTDINTTALHKARIGQYNKWSMRSISEHHLQNYFAFHENCYRLSSQIKDMVDFQYLNLNENTYPSILNNTNSQDLIICRNVLIYFNTESIKHLMRRFSKSLVGNGYLLLGASDPMFIEGLDLIFHHREGMIFSRQEVPSPEVLQFSTKLPQLKYTPKLFESDLVSTDKANIVLNVYEDNKAQMALDLISKANQAANIGQLDKAVQYCKDSIVLDSTNKNSYFILALSLIELNQLTEAEAMLRKTLFLDRKFVEGHFQLGLLLLKTKHYKEGLKSLKNALNIVNSNEPAQLVPGSQGLSYGRFAEILNAEIELYVTSGRA